MGLRTINEHVAGIDVGSEQLYVAVVNEPVKIFDAFTESLHALRDFLLASGVTSMAMEATRVYWIPICDVLEASGIEVCVVNGAHVKSLPGRKSDMADCQWLAELHSHGLLRGGFVPPPTIRRLRDYHRLRQDHVRMGSAHVQHMQKALDRMNLKIHNVLSETTGMSAMNMMRAIVRGVRDPLLLLDVCNVQVVQRKRGQLLKALRGNWRPEHVFALRQALAGWDFYQQQIEQCDAEMAGVLEELAAAMPPPPPSRNDGSTQSSVAAKRIYHNAPHIDGLKSLLVRVTGGHDLGALPALTDYTALQLISEIGTDMKRWPTVKHFTAWLGLAPSSRRSGKRKRREKRFRGRAAQILCVAARSLARSKYLALGGFYRRLRATRGPQVANVAAARKLAVLVYNTLIHGLEYVEQGLEHYERNYRTQCMKRLERNARDLGLTLVPLSPQNA